VEKLEQGDEVGQEVDVLSAQLRRSCVKIQLVTMSEADVAGLFDILELVTQ
jgi:hypothetical protein